MTEFEDDRLDRAFAAIGFYDRRGRRVSYSEFRRLRADLGYRFLARDTVGEVEVVTAWLGMDQGEGDPPWLFGTVTLARGGGLIDDEEVFASTEAEAATNHAEVLHRRTAERAVDGS